MTADATNEAEEAVRVLLRIVGEDTAREGLQETPGRVVRALKELTAGYAERPESLLGTVFGEGSGEMVVVSGIRVVSLCEHHLLPFVGTAAVGYIPSESGGRYRVVGLSKIPRLVECFARRLQVQERLTAQIADALNNAPELLPMGVGVVVRAHHSCMGLRGVQQPTGLMTTSALRGVLALESAARAEFLRFTE